MRGKVIKKRNTPIRSRSLVLLRLMPLFLRCSMKAQRTGLDLDVHYTTEYFRIANSCVGCQWLNGGGVELRMPLTPHLAATLNATVTQAGNVRALYSLTPGISYDLQQATYLAGLTYYTTRPASRFRPFGDVLVGAAYDTGALSPGNTGSASSGAFAAQFGGGLSIRLISRLTITPVRGDYLLTTFNNSTQNTQGALRWSAGVTFHIRRSRESWLQY
jgi:hypothetical protein